MPSIYEALPWIKPVTLHVQTAGIVDQAEISVEPMSIKIDATVSEEHSLQARATSFEVEDGSNLSDHIINKGVRLALQGVISDDPLTIESAALGVAAGIVGDRIGGIAGAVVTGGGAKLGGWLVSSSRKPSKSAYEALREVYDNKLAVTIVTGLTTYTNMVMESFVVPRNAKNSNSLNFTAKFKKVEIAEIETVIIPLYAAQEAPGVTQTVNRGTQAAQEASEKVSERGSSILYNLLF